MLYSTNHDRGILLPPLDGFRPRCGCYLRWRSYEKRSFATSLDVLQDAISSFGIFFSVAFGQAAARHANVQQPGGENKKPNERQSRTVLQCALRALSYCNAGGR